MVTIHILSSADFPDWEPLWQGYLRFYETTLDDDVTRLTFARLTDPNEEMYGFLARDETGRAVGMVNWLLHRATWTRNKYCYLEDLYVSPDVRGTGAGRALIEAVYAEARMLGCPHVYWLTQENNTEGRKLYDRIAKSTGFVHYRHAL